jgi:hypothetical protein
MFLINKIYVPAAHICQYIYIQEYSKARRRRISGNEIAALAKEFPHTRLDTRNYRLGQG